MALVALLPQLRPSDQALAETQPRSGGEIGTEVLDTETNTETADPLFSLLESRAVTAGKLLGSTHHPLRPFEGLLFPASAHCRCEVNYHVCR